MVICPMSVPVCGARPVRAAARVVLRMLLLLLCVRVMRGMMLRGMIGWESPEAHLSGVDSSAFYARLMGGGDAGMM